MLALRCTALLAAWYWLRSGALVPLEYQESLRSGLHAEHGAMNEHASPGCCDAGMMDLVSAGAMFPAGVSALTEQRMTPLVCPLVCTLEPCFRWSPVVRL